jgi:hypothetical protein
MRTPLFPRLAVALLLALSCCSTPNRKEADSSIDITYVQGHDRFRFAAESRNEQAVAKSIQEQRVVKETEVDRKEYLEFLDHVSKFVAAPKLPAPGEACRAPFTVSVRIGNDTQQIHGCRSTDDGALGRLVRRGEFLLYSQN